LNHEVAAWHTTAELPAGTYDINVSFNSGKAHLYAGGIEGVITQNYTPSIFGGVLSGGGRDGSEEVGNPYRGTVGIYKRMLEDNDDITVELTDEASEWLSPSRHNGFDYNEEHPAYKNILFLQKVEVVKKNVIENKYVYTINHAEEGGFLEDEKISTALKSGLNSNEYNKVIAVDYNLTKYSGKILENHGIEMKDAYEFVQGKSGEVSRFLAVATKELMDAHKIEVIKTDQEMSY
jgi:hypothetical protein